MRVAGDAEQCRRTGRQLLHAAEALGRTSEEVRAVWDGVPSWTGTAADAWAGQVLARARTALSVADRLAATGRALQEHADALDHLQSRAGRLVAEVVSEGLAISADGVVRVPERPRVLALDEADRRFHLERLQAGFTARARRLRTAELEAHDRLGRGLDRLGQPAVVAPGGLPVGWWDAPPPLVEGAVGATSRGSGGAALAARGALRALPAVGPVYAVAVDMSVGGRSAPEAVGRAVVSTAAGVGAVAALGTFAAGAAALAAAPVVVPVLVAAAAGVAVLTALDAALPAAAVDVRRTDPQVRPQPLPRPGEPPRASPAGCAPRPPAGRPVRRPEPAPQAPPAPPAPAVP